MAQIALNFDSESLLKMPQGEVDGAVIRSMSDGRIPEVGVSGNARSGRRASAMAKMITVPEEGDLLCPGGTISTVDTLNDGTLSHAFQDDIEELPCTSSFGLNEFSADHSEALTGRSRASTGQSEGAGVGVEPTLSGWWDMEEAPSLTDTTVLTEFCELGIPTVSVLEKRSVTSANARCDEGDQMHRTYTAPAGMLKREASNPTRANQPRMTITSMPTMQKSKTTESKATGYPKDVKNGKKASGGLFNFFDDVDLGCGLACGMTGVGLDEWAKATSGGSAGVRIPSLR